MFPEKSTNIINPQSNIDTPFQITSDVSAILHIIKTNQDVKTRRDAALYLIKLIEDGLELESEKIQPLFMAEKDIRVSSELKRIQNKLRIRKMLDTDPSSLYDKSLHSAVEENLLGQINRLRYLYDESLHEKGAFERKYKIIDQIAEAGMGRILLGIRLADNCRVAIKFLLTKELSKNNNLERLIARFKREGELLTRKFKHPHIVKGFEYGEADGEYFIVMEYLSGGTLQDMINKGPLDFDTFMDISFQLCNALEYMHRLGVIHRDIKPANIMFMCMDGAINIKLCDFGLSKDKSDASLSRISFQAGTDEYSSPQQLADTRTADERDDIFSMGKTFYEMLTGTIFAENSRYEEISELNNTVPKEIDAIVKKCIEFKKEDRFQSVTELHTAILQM